MTQLSTMVTQLQISTGRNDAAATAVMKQGINAAVGVAALMFRPSDVRVNVTVATVAAGYTSLATLSRYVWLEEVINTTAGERAWPMSFAELNSLLSSSVGSTRYWAEYGGSIYYRPIPVTPENLQIHYISFPAELVNDGDVIPMLQYESFIFSFAQAFVWAAFEEPDSNSIWTKVAEAVGVPHALMTKVRDTIQGQVPHGDDVQKSVSESAA